MRETRSAKLTFDAAQSLPQNGSLSFMNSSAAAELSPLLAVSVARYHRPWLRQPTWLRLRRWSATPRGQRCWPLSWAGQALTGSELAFLARISRPTASEHLARLVAARLLAVTRKRRFHYYRIASPLVASMLESIKAVASHRSSSTISSALGTRRRIALRTHLFRSSGRTCRSRDRGCPRRQWMHLADR